MVTATRRSIAPLPICETDALIVRLKKLDRKAGSEWNQHHITLREETLIGAATMIADSGALLAYSLDQYLVGKHPLPGICAAWGKATKIAFLAIMTVALGLFFPEVPRQFYRDVGLTPRPNLVMRITTFIEKSWKPCLAWTALFAGVFAATYLQFMPATRLALWNQIRTNAPWLTPLIDALSEQTWMSLGAASGATAALMGLQTLLGHRAVNLMRNRDGDWVPYSPK